MGERFTGALGCNDAKDVLSCLRSKTPEELMGVCSLAEGLMAEGIAFGPVVDGWVFQDTPMVIYNTGEQADVPLLIGTNANEGNSFPSNISLAKYRSWVEKKCGRYAEDVLSMFPADNNESVGDASSRLITVLAFTAPARFVARGMENITSQVYRYQFTRVSDTKEARELGAFHWSEVPYVFGHLTKTRGYNEIDFSLSQSIMKYWTNFAQNKDPNSTGLPDWPIYNSNTNKYLELGNKITVKENLDKKACDLLDNVLIENQKQLQR